PRDRPTRQAAARPSARRPNPTRTGTNAMTLHPAIQPTIDSALQQVEDDMRRALTLPGPERIGVMAHYHGKISDLAERTPDPEAAYRVLSAHADAVLDRLTTPADPATH
ncbi:hypothetical protein ACFW9F_22585, partial [Streptomyces sp. NPDC059506]|uniref:hypothetical protein n=1 Tax=Streptomyces sp. NPDC059506 TaxID=3347751 RepID=UPI00369873D9